MPFIVREDGEHFVIPSYRDVLTAKQNTALKKEILLLSGNYGDYVTLNRKAGAEYEVAFSPDRGYLLGESVWFYFNRPTDMIYCEALPDKAEAILVVVKAGSVYLDGSFPLDSIPEELVIFLTQQNNFEIYTYGNVPIVQNPETGKFSFDAASVKSFTILEKPIFASLPLLKNYHLELVDQVLRSQGIGVLPIGKILAGLAGLVLLYFAYSYITTPAVMPPEEMAKLNPFQGYNDSLTSPDPAVMLSKVADTYNKILTLPGWDVRNFDYKPGAITVEMVSRGSSAGSMLDWAHNNHFGMSVKSSGFSLDTAVTSPNRPLPSKIYPMTEIIATLVDRIASILPGNHLTMGTFTKKGRYTQVAVTINYNNISSIQLGMLSTALRDMPLTLESVVFTENNGKLNGKIVVNALGT